MSQFVLEGIERVYGLCLLWDGFVESDRRRERRMEGHSKGGQLEPCRFTSLPTAEVFACNQRESPVVVLVV